MYVPWDGKIYFRQYSDEDVESGSLWADFGFVSDREKKLMCINPDGSIEQAGTDKGFGPMFIVEGRIYSQGFSAENEYQVYSCALDGSGRIEYRTSQVLDVKNGRVICGTDSRGLSCIDTRTGQEQFFVNTYARYLGADDELIFFYGNGRADAVFLRLCGKCFDASDVHPGGIHGTARGCVCLPGCDDH